NQAQQIAASPARDLGSEPFRREWLWRYGWTTAPPPLLGDAQTRIRRVEFADVRDHEEFMWKGNDGIRETTWPGVYNRSRLTGRNDYLTLPDWNVYSFGGRTVAFHLPAEQWNRLEIQGAAAGPLSYEQASASPRALGARPSGVLRTTTVLPEM